MHFLKKLKYLWNSLGIFHIDEAWSDLRLLKMQKTYLFFFALFVFL